MLRLPEGNGTSSPSLMRSLLNIAKPRWTRGCYEHTAAVHRQSAARRREPSRVHPF